MLLSDRLRLGTASLFSAPLPVFTYHLSPKGSPRFKPARKANPSSAASILHTCLFNIDIEEDGPLRRPAQCIVIWTPRTNCQKYAEARVTEKYTGDTGEQDDKLDLRHGALQDEVPMRGMGSCLSPTQIWRVFLLPHDGTRNSFSGGTKMPFGFLRAVGYHLWPAKKHKY